MGFSIEESKEDDLIIKAATGNIKTRTIILLTLQAVRINNQGAPLLGLAIYYVICGIKLIYQMLTTI